MIEGVGRTGLKGLDEKVEGVLGFILEAISPG
jgi:hypothetical protein